jgi:hypothetical protein
LQGALLMALSFDAFLNPPDFQGSIANINDTEDIENTRSLEIYGIAFGCAVMISTALVMVSIMFIVNLHTMVHDEDVIQFLVHFGYYRIVLLALVTALSVSMLVGISTAATSVYTSKVFFVVLAVGCTAIATVLLALSSLMKFAKGTLADHLERLEVVNSDAK